MILARRLFNAAIVVTALAIAGLSGAAAADSPVPYSAEAFNAAQASGAPILIEIHRNG
jgi:hypothetical protein